jgi:hypothetical protein
MKSNVTLIGGSMPAQTIDQLKSSFRGELIQPTDAAYDSARKVYNGMIDKRPQLIARCVDVADVMAAVQFGRDNQMLTAIRGGGHNGAGLSRGTRFHDEVVFTRRELEALQSEWADHSLGPPPRASAVCRSNGEFVRIGNMKSSAPRSFECLRHSSIAS